MPENLLIFLENYGFLLFVLLLAGLGLLGYHITNNHPSLTGSATVLSKRVELAKCGSGGVAYAKTNNWNYLVTFQLTDGEELVLYTSQSEYDLLIPGLRGQLTWAGENFVTFLPEEG